MISSVFEGKNIRLAALDLDQDDETISRWTHDAEYLHLTGEEPARPVSPAQVRKGLQPETGAENNQFTFTIRATSDDRLIGIARLYWIDWPNGNAWVSIGIGDPQERGGPLAGEALDLILQYAFIELNLYRVTTREAEYHLTGQVLAEKAGFIREVTNRKAIQRAGVRWDTYIYGLLATDWKRVESDLEAAH